MVPLFQGTVGVIFLKNHYKMVIEYLYLLYNFILSNKAGRNQLAYEIYACNFAL